MPQIFQRIGLIGKYSDKSVAETLSSLTRHLKERGLHVVLDHETTSTLPDLGLETIHRTKMGNDCDLVIVVGGDGTLLNAARSLAGQDVPVLGINQGRLGFLVDVSPGEMTDRLDEILAGKYYREERSLLHTRLCRDGKCVDESDALNDVVIHKVDVARMIELEVTIDGHFVDIIRADGLIVSTPTGSTAYALSGGGPILHPLLDALVLVPICPHTLSNRPIVVNENSNIKVVLHDVGSNRAQLTHDGQEKTAVGLGDEIQICTKDHKLCLIHPQTYDYYEILRAKL
ncbi:MAG: NAD(+) kinase, partial [Gammaproteobacteria bacterium]